MPPMNPNRKTARAKAVHDAAAILPRRNEKNEITQWNSASENGQLLRMLVENGQIKPGMTAGDVRDKYELFKEYSYGCFSSALANTHKSLATELEARQPQTGKGGVFGAMKAYSNLLAKQGFEEDDDDADDETYQMSQMSMEDDDLYSFDNRTSAKSVSFFNHSSGRSIRSSAPISRSMGMTGSTPPRHPTSRSMKHSSMMTPSPTSAPKIHPVQCTLPYIVDYWFDVRPQERASIQVQMLSMDKEMLSRVSYRVSTGQNELVIMLPVSKHLGEGVDAFNQYVFKNIDPKERNLHAELLHYHPKTTARRLHLAELKKKSPAANTRMEFRIPLKRKFSLDFAT